MGNNCVGLTSSKDGFLLPTSFWWLLLPRRGTENSTLPSHQTTNDSESVLQKPPMVVQMKSFQHNECDKEETTSEESARESEVEIVVVVNPTEPEPKTKPKPGKLNMLPNIKRVSVKSAGLRVESVLLTNNGYFKQYYSLGAELGKGQFGITFLCLEKATGKNYACKSIAKVKLVKEDDLEDVRREIQIMHHLLGCPNMISIKGAYEDAIAVHVVMELCEGGELFDRIVERGHFTETKAAKLARTIVSVVESCHSRGIMHRDLKPENFLFVDQHEDSTLRAIDFGMSVFFKPGDIFTDVVGTPHYIAPEVINKCYGPEADVWSAGVIIYILLCGWPPFWAESEEEIFEEVLHGELDFSSDPWPSISESAKDLVRKMLVRDPRKRITAHEVLNHPWIQVDGVAPNKSLDSAVLSRLNQFSAMNKLKKMALRVIAKNLSEEETSVLKQLFNMIDTDNSGHITFEKLKVGLKMFGANLSESEAFDLMQAADVDNSGTIDYEEFITATLHINQVCKEDHLIAAFSYFDKDGNGYITQDELQQACKEFGMENVHLEEMIHEADQNNDGQIDYNEFVAMMKRGNVDLGNSSVKCDTRFSIGLREELSVC